MEVILLKDVKGVGKKGETKTVSDGYGNNFLIKNKFAVRKTEASIAHLEKEKALQAQKEEELRQEALKSKEKLSQITLEFKAKAQGGGNMAGTISTKEVEDRLKKEHGIVIDKRKFVEKYPINAFGYTNLKIELYKGVVAEIRVHVSEDK